MIPLQMIRLRSACALCQSFYANTRKSLAFKSKEPQAGIGVRGLWQQVQHAQACCALARGVLPEMETTEMQGRRPTLACLLCRTRHLDPHAGRVDGGWGRRGGSCWRGSPHVGSVDGGRRRRGGPCWRGKVSALGQPSAQIHQVCVSWATWLDGTHICAESETGHADNRIAQPGGENEPGLLRALSRIEVKCDFFGALCPEVGLRSDHAWMPLRRYSFSPPARKSTCCC